MLRCEPISITRAGWPLNEDHHSALQVSTITLSLSARATLRVDLHHSRWVALSQDHHSALQVSTITLSLSARAALRVDLYHSRWVAPQ